MDLKYEREVFAAKIDRVWIWGGLGIGLLVLWYTRESLGWEDFITIPLFALGYMGWMWVMYRVQGRLVDRRFGRNEHGFRCPDYDRDRARRAIEKRIRGILLAIFWVPIVGAGVSWLVVGREAMQQSPYALLWWWPLLILSLLDPFITDHFMRRACRKQGLEEVWVPREGEA